LSTPPTLSRRHASGAESARGLLFTVLGEFVLPHGGSVWTSTIIDVLARVGVEEKASRQALMRTAADGWLAAERLGRRTRWRLTEPASTMLTEGTARIFGFPGPVGEWDGRWLVVLARVPETERAVRHRLRTRLTWAGLGSPSPGVWVGTHANRLAEASDALADAGLLDDAQIFLATHAAGEYARLVRQSWNLRAIEAGYERFVEEFRGAAGADPLTRVVQLVHAWRRFPWTDPALPLELLPTPWSGAAAAELFGRRHRQWAAPARAEWQRIDGQERGHW
jgi:phenylacetic acid degradation operon negative regulatory protein